MSPSPSGSVRTGYVLVTGLLALGIVFGVLMVASVGVGLARHGDSLLYGDPLQVRVQVSPEDVRSLPRGLRVSSWLDTDVQVRDPTTRQMLLRSGLDFGPVVLFVAGLWLIRGLLRSVMDGDPFGPANVRRLRRLGYLLVVGGLVVALVEYALRSALLTSLPPYPSVHLGMEGFSLPGAALLGGLGAFIVAEVFAHGSRLREDVEGTV